MNRRNFIGFTGGGLCALFGLSTSSIPESERGSSRTYYVSKNGKDSNAGTKLRPKRTIAAGIELLQAGDTLRIYPGEYEEQVSTAEKRSK